MKHQLSLINLCIFFLLAENKQIFTSVEEKENFDEIPVVDISKVLSLSEKQKLKSTEWAEIIDVASPLDDFNELVPNPAFTWPFELDRFQKHVDNARQDSESMPLLN